MITVIAMDKTSRDFFDTNEALEFLDEQESVREVMCDTQEEVSAVMANNACIVSLTRNWANVRD